MAQTLESFVNRLRTDGVEAGRAAADQIRREAQEQAEQVVREAEAQAQHMLAEAESQRERTLSRTRTDLQLAARDTVARLCEALSQAATKLLAQAVEKTLDKPKFLEELIRDIATRYAEADATGAATMTINVAEPMRQQLTNWVIATFHQGAKKKDGFSVDLHGTLSGAGFEYQVADGTVEITPASVVQVLSEIVTPELRRLLSEAIKDSVEAAGDA
jgi:V/A-type H+-transporting ATPase subunit E